MTREGAKSNYYIGKHRKFKSQKTIDFLKEIEDSVNDTIDMIFEDFESMTCENCKNYWKHPNEEMICKKFAMNVCETFGCKAWESK